jgi:hypothetical protein
MEEARILLELRQYYASWTKVINCYIIPVVAVIIVISSTFVIMVYYKEYRSTENNIRKVKIPNPAKLKRYEVSYITMRKCI